MKKKASKHPRISGEDESVTSTSGAGERNKRARVVVTLNSSGTFDIEFKGTEVANNVKEALVLDIIKSISAKQELLTSDHSATTREDAPPERKKPSKKERVASTRKVSSSSATSSSSAASAPQHDDCEERLEPSPLMIGDFVIAPFGNPEHLFTGEIADLCEEGATVTVFFLDGDTKEGIPVNEVTRITIGTFCNDLKQQIDALKESSEEDYASWLSEREKHHLHVDWERPPTNRILAHGDTVLAAYPIPSAGIVDHRKKLRMFHAEIIGSSLCKMFYQVAYLDGKVLDKVHIDYIDKCSSDSFQRRLHKYLLCLRTTEGKIAADALIADRVSRKLISLKEHPDGLIVV